MVQTIRPFIKRISSCHCHSTVEHNIRKKHEKIGFYEDKRKVRAPACVCAWVRDSGMATVSHDEVLCENWKTKRIIVNCGRDCKLKLPMQIRTQQIGCLYRVFLCHFWLIHFGCSLGIMTVKDETDNLSLLTRLHNTSFSLQFILLHSVRADVQCAKLSVA